MQTILIIYGFSVLYSVIHFLLTTFVFKPKRNEEQKAQLQMYKTIGIQTAKTFVEKDKSYYYLGFVLAAGVLLVFIIISPLLLAYDSFELFKKLFKVTPKIIYNKEFDNYKDIQCTIEFIYNNWEFGEGKKFCKWFEEKHINNTVEEFIFEEHDFLGRSIRNNCGLWNDKSYLFHYFNNKGIEHADEMSGIIMTELFNYCTNEK